MALTAEEWITVGEVYQDSLKFVLDNNSRMLAPDVNERIMRFMYTYVLVQKPFTITTPQGMQHAVETVFTDEAVRDFVLTLVYVFFSRWGGTSQRFSELVESIAFAVSANGNGPLGNGVGSRNAIPKQLLEDLPKEDGVRSLLGDNKWMVVLLLMQLVVAFPAPQESKTKK
jgi:hypothetical protein